MVTTERTEHEKQWSPGDLQRCRRCNPLGIERGLLKTLCPDCDGSGWTLWAALATEPWTEVIPDLYVGGHDYNAGLVHGRDIRPGYPGDRFDVVISMYHRSGYEPGPSTRHVEILFPDSALNFTVQQRAARAARMLSEAHQEGQVVLSRCQAGLNRSSLVAGMAMVHLGFTGKDAVQLIRARRSPWALCNEQYAQFLQDDQAVKKALHAAERSEGIR